MSVASTHADTDPKPSAERPDKTAPSDRDADESKDSGAEQPTQSSAHVSPVTRLYRHALESIFAFLTLSELGCVLSVSCSWSAGVRSMGSIHATVVDLRHRSGVIAASSLAHHVSQIGVPWQDSQGAEFQALTSSDLFVLSRHLGSLTSLSCAVELSPPSRVFLGPSLQTLNVELRRGDLCGNNDAIVTISRLPNPTDLILCLSNFVPALSFAPLTAAAQLQSLTMFSNRSSDDIALHQLDQLRMLPQLRKMALPELNREGLAFLLRLPHSLQWQQIHEVWEMDEAQAAVLSNLPSLTELSAVGSSAAVLPLLPRLRCLSLHVDTDIAGLACYPELSELTVQAAGVTSKRLSQALSHLPLLRNLRVKGCGALESLSFLSERTQLAQSLQTLHLHDCRNAALHSTELKHVLTLKNLSSLTLARSFVEPLDSLWTHLLQPPTVLLPKLEHFANWTN